MPSPWAAPDTRKGPQIYMKSKLSYCLLLLNSSLYLPMLYFGFVHYFMFMLLYCFLVLVGCMSAMIAEEPEKISGWWAEMTFYKQCPIYFSFCHNLLTCF